MERMYFNSAPMCDDCGGGLYQARLSECNNPNHRVNDMLPTPLVSSVEHFWQNWEDAIGPTELAQPPYICKCGVEFDTHAKLMKHTAELNPIIESYELGRAGVAVERSAHEGTLKKLERALDFLEGAISAELVEANWENDVKTFLKEAGRYHNEPHEETGFGD